MIEHKNTWQPDYWKVLIVCGLYVTVEALFLPAFAPESWHVRLELNSIFMLLYQSAVAFVIAFPLADAQLAKQRYAAFAFLSLGILAASSLLLEFVIDPLLFGGKIIPVVTYIRLVEGGTIALLLMAVRLLSHRRRNEHRLAELERANIEAELQVLRAQINPHVLFNALNNIYSHALHKSEQTPHLILKLADMLRYMIYDCAEDEVSLEKEVAFLSDYVEVQTMALDGRGAVDFKLKGDIVGKRIAPFLLIPLVENCFKHSLDTLDHGIDIDINLEASGGRLRLDCSNTFDPQSDKDGRNRGAGIGLANVRRRLELLFDTNFALDLSPRGARFHAHLDVPVRS